MPNSCWAPGCVTGYRNPKGGYHGAGLSLFKEPKSPEERVVWERHIRRKNEDWERNIICVNCISAQMTLQGQKLSNTNHTKSTYQLNPA